MKSNTVIYIIFASIGLFGLTVFLLLFKRVEIPDVNTIRDYRLDSKELYGFYLFKSLVEKKYGAEKVVLNSIDTSYLDLIDDSCLLIRFGKAANYNADQRDSLLGWVEQGNHLLVLSDAMTMDSYLNQSYDRGVPLSDSIKLYYYEEDSLRDQFACDSLFKDFPFQKSMLRLRKASQFSFMENKRRELYLDSVVIFHEFDYLGGRIAHHSAPYLFSNFFGQHDPYLKHFNSVIHYDSLDWIIFDHPSFHTSNPYGRDIADSPLQFIIASPPLKWAYYLTLLLAGLYIWFSGKRKQRIIPVLEKNENTTMEYVETISSMYEKQAQHRKLVLKMRDIFYDTIKEKYYLDPKDPAYTSRLIRKSRIEWTDLEPIFRDFENAENRAEFSVQQLANVYRNIESFYKNMA